MVETLVGDEWDQEQSSYFISKYLKPKLVIQWPFGCCLWWDRFCACSCALHRWAVPGVTPKSLQDTISASVHSCWGPGVSQAVFGVGMGETCTPTTCTTTACTPTPYTLQLQPYSHGAGWVLLLVPGDTQRDLALPPLGWSSRVCCSRTAQSHAAPGLSPRQPLQPSVEKSSRFLACCPLSLLSQEWAVVCPSEGILL